MPTNHTKPAAGERFGRPAAESKVEDVRFYAENLGVISQRQERVYIETQRHRIMGMLTLARDGYRSRISDLLNASERDFISLTDVTVELIDHDGPGTEHPFIALSRHQIVFAIPESGFDEPGPASSGGAASAN